MISGGIIMERFIIHELDDSIRSILRGALDERKLSRSVLCREFEFNCFGVALDFEKGIVRVQDILCPGEDDFIDVPIQDFIVICALE